MNLNYNDFMDILNVFENCDADETEFCMDDDKLIVCGITPGRDIFRKYILKGGIKDSKDTPNIFMLPMDNIKKVIKRFPAPTMDLIIDNSRALFIIKDQRFMFPLISKSSTAFKDVLFKVSGACNNTNELTNSSQSLHLILTEDIAKTILNLSELVDDNLICFNFANSILEIKTSSVYFKSKITFQLNIDSDVTHKVFFKADLFKTMLKSITTDYDGVDLYFTYKNLACIYKNSTESIDFHYVLGAAVDQEDYDDVH